MDLQSGYAALSLCHSLLRYSGWLVQGTGRKACWCCYRSQPRVIWSHTRAWVGTLLPWLCLLLSTTGWRVCWFYSLFEGRSPEPLVQRVKDESLRNMHYVYTYLYDPNDKLYFQTYELFRIDKPHYDQYLELTQGKGARNYEPGGGEREKVDGVPVEKRKLTKSLIACVLSPASFSMCYFSWFKADRKQWHGSKYKLRQN